MKKISFTEKSISPGKMSCAAGMKIPVSPRPPSCRISLWNGGKFPVHSSFSRLRAIMRGWEMWFLLNITGPFTCSIFTTAVTMPASSAQEPITTVTTPVPISSTGPNTISPAGSNINGKPAERERHFFIMANIILRMVFIPIDLYHTKKMRANFCNQKRQPPAWFIAAPLKNWECVIRKV